MLAPVDVIVPVWVLPTIICTLPPPPAKLTLLVPAAILSDTISTFASMVAGVVPSGP